MNIAVLRRPSIARKLFFLFTLLICRNLAVAVELPTVVSTNLCADQALLSLADPNQILSISIKGHDPKVSLVAEQAQRYPSNRGSAEEILQLHPDVVIASRSWAGGRQGQLLAEHGIRIVVLPNPQTFPTILAATQKLADEIGRGQEGKRLVDDVQQRIEKLQRTQVPLTALYLRSNGGSAGKNTFVDSVFDALGLINMPARAGISGWGRYPLEQLVQEPPQLLVLGYFERQRPLSKSLYAQHRAVRELLEQRPHVDVPTTYWGCGGWQLVEAAERIAAQIAQLPIARSS
jgi:iron complex transport system substrate-binding protein